MKQNKILYMRAIKFVRISILLLPCCIVMARANAQHAKQSLNSIHEAEMEISTKMAHYKPIFGEGDDSKKIMKAIKRFAQLSVDPKGKSKIVKYGREELAYYVLSGTGMLHYGNIDMPISKNDFFYIPIGTNHGFSNPREDTITMLVMGVEIPKDTVVKPTPDLKIASANDMAFQMLSKSHGPSSKYQLLMGTTRSIRDRLASANQISSLFVIDFEPGGTNIPHRHKDEEEIYYMLEGNGEMVAGESAEGKEVRFPVKKGDAFFYAPNTLVGFYSPTKPETEHTRILAIRVKYPGQK